MHLKKHIDAGAVPGRAPQQAGVCFCAGPGMAPKPV